MIPKTTRVLFLLAGIFLFVSTGFAQKAVPRKPLSEKKVFSLKKFLPGCRGDHWLAEDKFRHFFGSAFLAGFGYTASRYWSHAPRQDALLFGGGFAFSLGLGKELHDKYAHAGCASWKDLTADVLGEAFGLLFYTETIRFQFH